MTSCEPRDNTGIHLRHVCVIVTKVSPIWQQQCYQSVTHLAAAVLPKCHPTGSSSVTKVSAIWKQQCYQGVTYLAAAVLPKCHPSRSSSVTKVSPIYLWHRYLGSIMWKCRRSGDLVLVMVELMEAASGSSMRWSTLKICDGEKHVSTHVVQEDGDPEGWSAVLVTTLGSWGKPVPRGQRRTTFPKKPGKTL